MKRLMTSVFLICASVAFAGNVCVWTGGGDDNKWSTAGNWDTAPVSGNGDELIFRTGEGGEVDAANFTVARIRCEGTDPITIGGTGSLTFAGTSTSANTILLTNCVPLTVNVPIKITNSGQFAHLAKAVYNGDVTIEGSHTIAVGAYKPDCNYKVTYNGAFYGPDAKIRFRQGKAQRALLAPGVWFYKPIHVDTIAVSTDYHSTGVYLCATGNTWRVSDVCFGHIVACCENAFPSDLEMDWGKELYTRYIEKDVMPGWKDYTGAAKDTHSAYNLNGFDQTINRIAGSNYPWKTDGTGLIYDNYSIESDTPATLTMLATADGDCYARVNGQVSLVWAPEEARTLTFSNRVSMTKGTITVSNGTVRVVGAGSFTNLSAIVVRDGATFHLDSTLANALQALGYLTLGEDAIFRVGDNASAPFCIGPEVRMRTSSHIYVPTGVTLNLGRLLVDGEWHFGETIESGDYDWISGGGNLTIAPASADDVHWRKSVSGDWTDGTKWLPSGVPASDDRIFIDPDPGCYTVRVDSAVSYTGSNLVAQAEASIVVGTGGTLTLNPPHSVGIEQEVITLRGAELVVDGGTVDATGGSYADKTEDNFHGQLNVEGYDGKDGAIKVKSGAFNFNAYWGGRDGNAGSYIRLGNGGRFEVSGDGVADIRTGWWWNEPFAMDGGTVDVSGSGELRVGSRSTESAGNHNAYYFGSGSVTFRDNAVFSSPRPCQTFIPCKRLVPVDLTCEFKDHARLDITRSLILGTGHSTDAQRNECLFTFDSDATHNIGIWFWMGVDAGRTQVDFKRGTLNVGAYGFTIGTYYYHNSAVNTACPEGIFNLKNGTVVLTAGTTQSTQMRGLHVGTGVPVLSGSYKAGDVAIKATLDISGGAFTNKNGCTLVGGGHGVTGMFRQSAGDFYAGKETEPLLVGWLGGKGTCEMSGGTASFAGDAYIGGVTTNLLGTVKPDAWYALSVTGRVGFAAYGVTTDLTIFHDAQGTLCVSGGTFNVGGDLMFSYDGTGDLEIGAGGTVTANNVIFSNGVSTAAFTFGEAGVGRLAARGALTVTTGTKLTIDATAYAGSRSFFPLITAASVEGRFADGDITVTGITRPYRIVQNGRGIRLEIPHGTVVVFR